MRGRDRPVMSHFKILKLWYIICQVGCYFQEIKKIISTDYLCLSPSSDYEMQCNDLLRLSDTFSWWFFSWPLIYSLISWSADLSFREYSCSLAGVMQSFPVYTPAKYPGIWPKYTFMHILYGRLTIMLLIMYYFFRYVKPLYSSIKELKSNQIEMG